MMFDGIFISAAIASLGLSIGWLIGASQTPVSGVALPLLFALIGIAFVRFQERRSGIRQLIDVVGTLDDDLRSTALEILRISVSISQKMIVIWGVATIVLVLSLLWGIEIGTTEKKPNYPNLSELIGENAISQSRWDVPHKLEFLRRDLIKKNYGPEAVRSIFSDCITLPYSATIHIGREEYTQLDMVIQELTGAEAKPIQPPPSQLVP